jgi:hypothetical protein
MKNLSDEDRVPLSVTEAVERYGWPSELLGPIPRTGGPGCERFRSMRDRWRAYADQRHDIAAAVAAEDGRFEDVNDALDQCERETLEWTARAAGGDPSAEGRLAALRVRRVYLLSLRDQQPPRP